MKLRKKNKKKKGPFGFGVDSHNISHTKVFGATIFFRGLGVRPSHELIECLGFGFVLICCFFLEIELFFFFLLNTFKKSSLGVTETGTRACCESPTT